MVVVCCVKDCPTKKEIPGVKVHAIPKDPELRQKWVDFVTAENGVPFAPAKRASLCSLHFDENNYLDGRPKWRGYPTVSVKRQYTPFRNATNPVLINGGLQTAGPFLDPETVALHVPTAEKNCKESAKEDVSVLALVPQAKEDALAEAKSVPGPSSMHREETRKTQRNLIDSFPGTASKENQKEFDVGPSATKRPKVQGVGPEPCKIPGRVCYACGQSVEGMAPISVKGASASEVMELQSMLRQEKRIAYAGDITAEDMKSPNRAVRCYAVLQSTIKETRDKLEASQKKVKRLEKKCESLQSLIKELENKRFITHETRSLPQDHLERYFSVVRASRGAGNNPTVSQFHNSYVQDDLGGRKGANCVPLDSTGVLTVSSKKRRVADTDNLDCELDEDRLRSDEDLLSNHNFDKPVEPLLAFVEGVIEYIAGFVSRRVAVETKCAQCAFALFGEKSNSVLFKAKNRGAWLIASADVVVICRRTESELRRSKANKKMFTTDLLRHQINIKRTLPRNIFDTLSDHNFDCDPLSSHKDALIKLIIKKFLVVRVCSKVKKFNDELLKARCRQKLTHTGLGQ